MRVLVFLLVLANLLFFVWTQGYLGSPENPDAVRLRQQLQAERISIVARGEPPAPAVAEKQAEPVVPAAEEQQAEVPAAKKEAEIPPAKKEAAVCLRWSELAAADADRLERQLAAKFPALKATRSNSGGTASWWVFIPPLASRPDADRKAAELKRLNVPEFFILQDAGPSHLAISLGIFSTGAAARERLETLRAQGVRSARVGERTIKPGPATVEITVAGTQAAKLREALPEHPPALCKEKTP